MKHSMVTLRLHRIAVIFIVINYALSRLAIYVERRLSRSKKSVVAATAVVEEGAPMASAAMAVGAGVSQGGA